MQLVTRATKAYRTRSRTQTVFKGLTLRMSAGTRLVMMGPNACGKSTLLRVLIGLADVDSGSVDLKLSARDHRGVVLQDYRSQLLLHTTVERNLVLPLAGSKAFAGERRAVLSQAEELLELLGYRICLGSRALELSGGQQQAVVLARALAFAGDVLLWDEPMSALDYSKRVALYRHICDSGENKGRSMVITTHDLDESLILADRLLIFDSNMRVLFESEIDRPSDVDRLSYLRSHDADTIRRAAQDAMSRGTTHSSEDEI